MERGKRVAILMTSAISFNHLMRGQLEYLRSEGATLDFYSGGPENELRALRERGVGRVCYVPFRREPSLFWDLVSLGWLTMLLIVRRYDTVVYSTPKAMFVGSMAAWLARQKRRIAWVRGRAYENFKGRKRALYVALDRICFRLSNTIVLVSRSLVDAYDADGIDIRKKALVVGHGSSNGVDTSRFRPLAPKERTALRRRMGLEPGDFVIVVVGRIRDDKGAREILELSRRLADVPHLRIAMVGTIEEPALIREIKGHGDRLRSFAPASDVERFFQIADLHLFLSHREGFGNVAIEAAAAGVPTFGFDVVGVRNSVIDAATGQLFSFGDLDSLEAAIRSAASDPLRFRAEFSNSREVVSERFSQDAVWHGYAGLFLGQTEGRGEGTGHDRLTGARGSPTS
jgi:glycosyltransferase involved in cell wall biosynthesis